MERPECPVPDAPDEQKSSRPIGPPFAPDGPLGEALQTLIHAQAQQAACLAELADQLASLSDAIRELVAHAPIGGGEEEGGTPEVGLDGQRIVRR